MTVLTLKEQPVVPLEAESLCPDTIDGKSEADVRALPLFHGKRQCRLDDFFTVDGTGSGDLELRGDLAKVKWVGRGTTKGRITVRGNVGMHLGAHMKGGAIEVHGNASDWVGAEMTGGLIHIHGNTGGQVGAAYRGSMSGMNNGTILIEGSAGLEVGMRMKRGIIAVRGLARDFAGLQMKGGTLILMSGAEIRAGAWMTRGTIVSLAPLRMLPTFIHACEYFPSFLRIYAKHLQPLGFSIPFDGQTGSYQRYAGDTSVPGKGEILVWKPAGPK